MFGNVYIKKLHIEEAYCILRKFMCWCQWS